MKKTIPYQPQQSEYEVQLKPAFNWWWLLLLLLPMLLLIRCEKTVRVQALTKDGKPVTAPVKVNLQYHRYIPLSEGKLVADSTIVKEATTDSTGIATFKGIRYSVYSYVFHWGTRLLVQGSSSCYVSDTLSARFHGVRDEELLKLYMNPQHSALQFKVIDKDDREALPGSKVWMRTELNGTWYTDSAVTDAAGMVRFPNAVSCGKVQKVYGSHEGYYPDSIINKTVSDLMKGSLDSARTLRLRPIRVPIKFFVVDCETGKGIEGVDVDLNFTYRDGRTERVNTKTNENGVGKGTYDSARLESKVHIIGKKPGYEPGELPGEHAIGDFIKYPDAKRTFCLKKIPVPPLPPLTKPCDNEAKSGGTGVTKNTYDLGSTPGYVTIDYDMADIPDRLEVIYDGQPIDGTKGEVKHDNGSPIRFYYDPKPGKPTYVTIVVKAPTSGTVWEYSISCPQ